MRIAARNPIPKNMIDSIMWAIPSSLGMSGYVGTVQYPGAE
jgi:hypothetical protein